MLQKKRKLAAPACQKSRRDMPGDRKTCLTGRSRHRSSRPRHAEQVGNELLEAARQPGRRRVLALVEVQRRGGPLERLAQGIVGPQPGKEEDRDRRGQVETLLQCPQPEAGRPPVDGGHDDVEHDERDGLAVPEPPHTLREERLPALAGHDLVTHLLFDQQVFEDRPEQQLVVRKDDGVQHLLECDLALLQREAAARAPDLDPSHHLDLMGRDLLAATHAVQRLRLLRRRHDSCAPSCAMASTLTAARIPRRPQASAITPPIVSASRSTSATTVEPAPLRNVASAPAPRPASRTSSSPGNSFARYGWCRRSRVASSRRCKSSATIAPTKSAARPTL